MFTKSMIEAEYQMNLVKAEKVYKILLEQAEKDRNERLSELRKKEREDYKYEQLFFYQG